MVLEERYKGLLQLRIVSWDGKEDYYLDFGEPAYTAETASNPEFDTHLLRYVYTSMKTPDTVFQYDMKNKTKEILKQKTVMGGYDASQYVTERFFVPSHDGVEVPVSMVYKRDLRKNEGNPLVLYGYGSYGNSLDAYFLWHD